MIRDHAIENENKIIEFIRDKANHRIDIANEYFKLIYHEALHASTYNYSKINNEILKRYKPSGLIYIKELAWKIFDNLENQLTEIML